MARARAGRDHGLTRRRAMLLLATAAGLGLPRNGGFERDGGAPSLFDWRGSVLGAESRMLLVHPDPTQARRAIETCLAEVARLERSFSLYVPDSELALLNRDGRVPRPSLDMRLVLEEAHRVSVASGGAFDATVQPLWRLIADRLSRSEAISPQALDSARRLVAFDCIDCRSDTVMLARPGMAVTLNGIAQGYITDRVADLLHDLGFDRVLVQLGESMALAPPAEERAWQIAVPDPRDSGRDLWTLALSHRAVATSSGLALKFDAGGRRHHLLDPRTGDSPNHHLSVTVLAARAMRADALSTALFVLPSDAAAGALAALGGGTALILHADGRTTRLDVGRGAA